MKIVFYISAALLLFSLSALAQEEKKAEYELQRTFKDDNAEVILRSRKTVFDLKTEKVEFEILMKNNSNINLFFYDYSSPMQTLNMSLRDLANNKEVALTPRGKGFIKSLYQSIKVWKVESKQSYRYVFNLAPFYQLEAGKKYSMTFQNQPSLREGEGFIFEFDGIIFETKSDAVSVEK